MIALDLPSIIERGGVRRLRRRRKAAHPSEGALAASFLIGFLLFPDVLLHTLQLKSHRGHGIPTRPAMVPHEVPILLWDAPRNGQCTLPFQAAAPRSHRVLGRNLQ